ncbi:oxidoreductase [Paramyrothecium foliicola]|nr:oxidoreductase [Paramyrothecium foliicola]
MPSRGLGLGFATVLLKNPQNVVVATARNPSASEGLQQLKAAYPDGRLHLVQLDVADVASVRRAAEETALLLPSGLDNLVSNAGPEMPQASFEDMCVAVALHECDLDALMEEVGFNLKTTITVIREFLPLVRKSEAKKIAVISSILGSIDYGYQMVGLANAYSVSKAALNMLVRKWSSYIKNDGIITAIIHPGWSGATQIGSGISDWIAKYAPETPNLPIAKSAEDCMNVLGAWTPEDNGQFFNHDGTKLPW